MFLPKSWLHGIPIDFHQSYTSNINPNFKVCMFQKDRAVYSVHALMDVLAAVEISGIAHPFFPSVWAISSVHSGSSVEYVPLPMVQHGLAIVNHFRLWTVHEFLNLGDIAFRHFFGFQVAIGATPYLEVELLLVCLSGRHGGTYHVWNSRVPESQNIREHFTRNVRT